MRNLGWPELLVILLVIVVLFGARKLPDLARSLGKSLSEFKKGRDEAAKPGPTDTGKKDEDSKQ
jgi:sec-independent protein translocase protein TatA